MPKSQWFVIDTLSGQENKVKENIEKRIKVWMTNHWLLGMARLLR